MPESPLAHIRHHEIAEDDMATVQALLERNTTSQPTFQSLLELEHALLASPDHYPDAAKRLSPIDASALNSDSLAQLCKLWAQATSKCAVAALEDIKQPAHKALFALLALSTPDHGHDIPWRAYALRALTNLAAKTLRRDDKDLISSSAAALASVLYPSRSAARLSPSGRLPSAQSSSAFASFAPPSQSRSRAPSQASDLTSASASDLDLACSRPSNTIIQVDALQCLIAIANVSPTALHPHWHFFLPSQPLTIRQNDNLLALLEFSKSSTVRFRACQATNALLQGGTSFLNLADDRSRETSYTSLSSRLAGIVATVHQVTTRLLRSRTHQHHAKFSVELAKLSSTIALHSPYHRLRAALPTELASGLLRFLELQNDSTLVLGHVFTAALHLLRKVPPTGRDRLDDFLDPITVKSMNAIHAGYHQREAWDLLSAVEEVKHVDCVNLWLDAAAGRSIPGLDDCLLRFIIVALRRDEQQIDARLVAPTLTLCEQNKQAIESTQLIILNILPRLALLDDDAQNTKKAIELLIRISKDNWATPRRKCTLAVIHAIQHLASSGRSVLLSPDQRQSMISTMTDDVRPAALNHHAVQLALLQCYADWLAALLAHSSGSSSGADADVDLDGLIDKIARSTSRMLEDEVRKEQPNERVTDLARKTLGMTPDRLGQSGARNTNAVSETSLLP